jgi:hypothetical protein
LERQVNFPIFSNRVLATFIRGNEATQAAVTVSNAVVAGWTGRDSEAVERHIRELEELGVARPASIPTYYRVAASRFTSAPVIEVSGEQSSGEVEFVLLQSNGRLWVGAGSDHTDRLVESYNVTVSKQMCDKPVATTFWAFDDVAGHWDQLRLRSSIHEHGETVRYQDGPVSAMRAPLDLIGQYTGGGPLPEGTMMMCGTLAAAGGIRPSRHFHLSLEDPVLGRQIEHAYEVRCLPIAR